jgi:hypothetical protein
MQSPPPLPNWERPRRQTGPFYPVWLNSYGLTAPALEPYRRVYRPRAVAATANDPALRNRAALNLWAVSHRPDAQGGLAYARVLKRMEALQELN